MVPNVVPLCGNAERWQVVCGNVSDELWVGNANIATLSDTDQVEVRRAGGRGKRSTESHIGLNNSCNKYRY